jgi:transcriptional regulator with XRE-family HTH domain
MEVSSQHRERKKRFKQDPDYILHGLLCDIAEDIYVAMEEQGLSQAELAQRIGVKRQFVNRFLNTPQNTTLRTIVRLATALGLEFDYDFKPLVEQSDEEAVHTDILDDVEVPEPAPDA